MDSYWGSLHFFSFDHFIPNSERVFRVNLKIDKDGQNVYNGAKTPRALYFALQNDIPEIEANTVTYFEKCLVRYKDISFANQDVLWVEDGFEKVFPLEMVQGIADYSRPRSGTISETAAKTFFGNTNPIGEIIEINQGMLPIEVTGVFKDLPSNTHFSAQYFASVKTWVEMEAISEAGDWGWNGWWSYIKLEFNNPQEAIGRQIYYKGNNQHSMEIIGVVADFHNEGLQKSIYPIVWNNHYPNEFGYFAARTESMNAQKSLEQLKLIWDKHYTQDNFDFIFAQEQFNMQYLSESRFGKLYL